MRFKIEITQVIRTISRRPTEAMSRQFISFLESELEIRQRLCLEPEADSSVLVAFHNLKSDLLNTWDRYLDLPYYTQFEWGPLCHNWNCDCQWIDYPNLTQGLDCSKPPKIDYGGVRVIPERDNPYQSIFHWDQDTDLVLYDDRPSLDTSYNTSGRARYVNWRRTKLVRVFKVLNCQSDRLLPSQLPKSMTQRLNNIQPL